jgi:hypothetical protein
MANSHQKIKPMTQEELIYWQLLNAQEREIARLKALINYLVTSFEEKVNKPLSEVYQDIRTPIGISEITEPYKKFLNEQNTLALLPNKE